jgi:uncharacterized membrane protein YphA (DoxX/SURF4 family)
VKEFAAAPLPPALVGAYATALPFVEGGIGLLLVLGLFTRPALVAAMLVIMSLIFGSSLLEKWSLVGDQMLYWALHHHAGAALAAQPPVPRPAGPGGLATAGAGPCPGRLFAGLWPAVVARFVRVSCGPEARE